MGQQLFFTSQNLGGDQLMHVLQYLQEHGADAGYSNDEDVYFQAKAGRILLEKGATQVLRDAGVLEEAVLPDGIPRSDLADTIRYMLTLMNPEQELLIIDPYLFPAPNPHHPDPNYVAYLESIIGETLTKIDRLRIVTKANRHAATEAAFNGMALGKKAALNIASKYTTAFHDRFWIADGIRGLFVGTSLNGIGRRYSLIDYLRDEDAADIYARYNALP
jgi:hypothetical protein